MINIINRESHINTTVQIAEEHFVTHLKITFIGWSRSPDHLLTQRRRLHCSHLRRWTRPRTRRWSCRCPSLDLQGWPLTSQTASTHGRHYNKQPGQFRLTEKSFSHRAVRVRWLAAVSVPPTSQSTNHTPGQTVIKCQGVAVRSPPLSPIFLLLILTLLVAFIVVVVGGTWGQWARLRLQRHDIWS